MEAMLFLKMEEEQGLLKLAKEFLTSSKVIHHAGRKESKNRKKDLWKKI